MSVSFETVLQSLVTKVDDLTALAVAQNDKITALTNLVTSLQLTQSAPRTRKPTTAGSTAAGIDAQTGQPTEKFPANTILWLKKKAAENPRFLPDVLSEANYKAIEAKHATELAGLSDVDRRRKMAQKVWVDLGELAERATHVETRDHALKLMKWLKDSWTAEKNAFKNSVPTVNVTTETLVADAPIFTQPLVSAPSVVLPTHDNSSLQSLSLQHLSMTPLTLSKV